MRGCDRARRREKGPEVHGVHAALIGGDERTDELVELHRQLTELRRELEVVRADGRRRGAQRSERALEVAVGREWGLAARLVVVELRLVRAHPGRGQARN